MSTEYRLDLLKADGTKFAEVTDFLSLAYSRQVNAPGLLSFDLGGSHAAISQLENNSQVIVYRRNVAMGLVWTQDFFGLYRGQTRQYTDHDVFSAQAPGILTMLGWRIVGFHSGVEGKSQWTTTAGETVMKNLVTYNCTSLATVANGRVRAGAITGVSVEADSARGNVISRSYAWKSVLESLQDLITVAGGDFDLMKTGAQAFEFRFYPGQLGTDRTATVLFALERGNMAAPQYAWDRTKEQTVAIVGGQGQGADRSIEIRTGADFASSTNDQEMFVDARNETTTAAMDANGDAKLYDARARPTFSFSVLQTPASFYGVHYQLGDLVKASYLGIETTQKIMSVAVSLDQSGAEKIDVGTMLV